MPRISVLTPASNVPVDRLALEVDWVRPGSAGISANMRASGEKSYCASGWCFAGSEE